MGNTYFPAGGTDVTISHNTFPGMKYGGIRAFAARGCKIHGNKITCSSDATLPAIILGNLGTGAAYRSYNNDIFENTLVLPAGGPAVAEFDNGIAWNPGDRNWVGGNRISGTSFEFAKQPSSSSTTKQMISSQAAGLSAADDMTVVRNQAAGGLRGASGRVSLIPNAVVKRCEWRCQAYCINGSTGITYSCLYTYCI
jgi:hypothetical protein